MARLNSAIMCARQLLDRDTNLVSYIDIIEQFNTSQLPVNLPPLWICTRWAREADQEELVMRVVHESPSGECTIMQTTDPTPLKSKRHRIFATFIGYEVKDAGEHKISIQIPSGEEWNEVGAIFFDINLNEERS